MVGVRHVVGLVSVVLASSIGIGAFQPSLVSASSFTLVQTPTVTPSEETTTTQDNLCPDPALSRVQRHTVISGETLDSIAQAYGLVPTTLIGFNPNLRQPLPIGSQILVPPYNGIQVSVPAGQTWQDLSARYNVPADVLFEINGCVATVPRNIFVPGINGPLGVASTPATPSPTTDPLTGYPLPVEAAILMPYGWQADLTQGDVVFHSGVMLQATPTTSVLAVGSGVVAFAGMQEGYGNLVVVNHDQGLQTRYANLGTVAVTVGQQVKSGTVLGAIAPNGDSAVDSFLMFEVRLNSDLGWVAKDPQLYIPELAL